ncbi:MAG: succinate dehydrogenase, cytochrome b556 subunit [Candidatus Krumholzibacteria bacterium]|nr:succinate dehydrogenase, cytochrome b556 subunit [Candidatus Krumholzibacteria bacterium]
MRALQRYRIHLGTAAWILHRLSGLALILYLLTHIWVIHHLIVAQKGVTDGASFDAVMQFFNNPLFKALEIGLVGVILYHLWNGLRITLIDLGVMVERQKTIFATAVIIWLVTWGVVAYAMLTKVGGLLSAVARLGGGGLS